MNFYDDKIEAYLTGKLTVSDKLVFEEGMAKDPLLKNEVELQKDIIESIRNARKLQLKTRLNNIEVGSTITGVSSAVKIAASFIVVGLIGAGVYYLSVFSTDEKSKEKEKDTNVVVVEKKTITDLNSTTKNNVKNNKRTSGTVEIHSPPRAEKNRGTPQQRTSATVTKETDQEIQAKANVPNAVIEDTESDRIYRDKTIEIPDGGIVETSDRKTASPDIAIDDKNKKDFSYKYYSNKLYLYGDFQDQPYNLVEINTPKSKQLYLYYDGKYYELRSNQTKSTRLKEVKDSLVLEQLTNKNK